MARPFPGIFPFLADGIASGNIQAEDAGFKAILYLSGRAMLSAEAKECAALDILATKLRHARRSHMSDRQGRI